MLGIDPGTRKVGFALVSSENGVPAALGIEPLGTLVPRLRALAQQHAIHAIALGRGTHAQQIAELLAVLGLPIVFVDETDTTYRARALYFADNPPRGWRRLVPLGLQLPPRPIDDYAALLIARRYQKEHEGITA